MHNFLITFWVVYVMVTWFNTTAFLEYCRLFRILKWVDYEGYQGMKMNNFGLTYPEFIANRHCNFFTRLLNCPLCLAVWIESILYIFIPTPIAYFAPNYLLSLVLYFLLVKLIDFNVK